MDNKQFFKLLAKMKKTKVITPQQYKTLRGQYYSGNIDGAEKGLHTIIQRYYNKNNKVAREG